MTYDNDYPDEYDYDEDESSDLLPCPACGAEIYEDSQQCPVCGNYITFGSHNPWSGRPIWWIALGTLGVVALIVALVAWGL